LKKPIVLSNLAMRFYFSDGWTKPELDMCCLKGEVSCKFPEDTFPYYTLEIGANFNLDALLEIAYVANPHKLDEELKTDREILEGYNS